MADDARKNPGPFDVRTVEHLVALMSKHELSEIDLRHGELRIRLRRGGAAPIAAPKPMTESPLPTGGTSGGKPPESPSPVRQLIEIKSPAVGTFYAQEKPASPPYVTVGSRVMPSTIVCQIEAMKIFNEIQAECSGVIVEVLVKNKDFVEFDTVLFRVDPAA